MNARSFLASPLLTALLALLVGLVPIWGGHAQAPAEASALEGTWNGTLEVGGTTLQIVFHLQTESDSLTATMDSPDQGATGIPVSRVRASGDSLHLSVSAIGGRFDGAIGPDAERIEGSWTQGGRSFPLTLERGGADTTEVRRPQTPSPPYPYDTTGVRFRNEADDVTLAGTLTVPEGEGPHPAVVLVSGSGPQTRNSEVFGHALFHVVADYLTRQGIAVLRYDERGVGASTGTYESATTEDLARDVEAAVEALAVRHEIDAHQIGLYGHSEGGAIAPMVATRSDRVAFLVLLAPPGVPGRALLPEQAARIREAGGASPAAVDSARSLQRRLVEALAEAPDSSAAAARVQKLLEKQGVSGEQAEAQVGQLTSPWLRFFLTHDPQPVLQKVDVPTLVLFGEHDLQVPPDQNRPPVADALRAAGRDEVTVRTVSGVNHLFQPSDTGLPSEYQSIETTMAPKVLKQIAGWLDEHTRGP